MIRPTTTLEAITYLVIASTIFLIFFKLNVNDVIKSIFYNKMSLNRLIVVALTFVVIISMIMKENQITGIALGGLIGVLQTSKKDGKTEVNNELFNDTTNKWRNNNTRFW